jgi:hypothetical protein
MSASTRNPEKGQYFTDKFPIQSFLWGDYTADPGTTYQFEVIPVYGIPTAPELREALKLTLSVTTEKEDDGNHGIWFNRGAIASQAYARRFQNHKRRRHFSHSRQGGTRSQARGGDCHDIEDFWCANWRTHLQPLSASARFPNLLSISCVRRPSNMLSKSRIVLNVPSADLTTKPPSTA